MKKRFPIPLTSFLCGVALIFGMQLDRLFTGDPLSEQLDKFNTVLSLVEKNYVDKVDTPKLVESAINGAFGQLDPHSIYIPPKNLAQVNEEFQGVFEGIGV